MFEGKLAASPLKDNSLVNFMSFIKNYSKKIVARMHHPDYKQGFYEKVFLG